MTIGLLSFAAMVRNNLLTAKTLINGFDTDGFSYAFQNFARVMGSQGSGNAGFQEILNSDGYPTVDLSVAGIAYASNTLMPASQVDPSITWVMSWVGKGGIQLGNGIQAGPTAFTVTAQGSGTLVWGSSTPQAWTNGGISCTGTNGYVEFTCGAGASQLNVGFSQFISYGTPGGGNTMSNLQLYRKSDQNTGQTQAQNISGVGTKGIFTSEFISLLTALNPKIFRAMNWGQTVDNNLTRWANRPATTQYSFMNVVWNPALSGSTTTGTSSAYISTNPSASPATGAYVDGETVQVKFNAANTGSPTTTCKVNRTGGTDVVIADLNGSPIAASTIGANDCGTLRYDALLNYWLLDLSSSASNNVNGGILAGVPIEIMVSLCNQINCNFWYCVPIDYDLASVTSMVGYVRDNLNPGLSFWLEYVNEHWNTRQTQVFPLCNARGGALGFPDNNGRRANGYYGLRVKHVMGSAIAAWSPRTRSQLVCVNGVGAQAEDPTSAQFYQFNGGDLVNNHVDLLGVTITISTSTMASPFNGLNETWPIVFTTTGALPTGITAGTTYYIKNSANDANGAATFQISATPGGTAITLSGTQSGTQTCTYTNPFYVSLINADYSAGSPTFSRPIDVCDAVSYATYYAGATFSPGDYSYQNAAEIAAMTNAADTNNLGWVDDQIRRGTLNTATCSLPGAISGNVVAVTNSIVGGNNDIVSLSSSGTMPTINGTTASSSTVYYVVNQTSTTLQLSLTRGGSPATISGGTGTLTIGSVGGETLLWFSNFLYPAWETVVASYDGARPSGFSNLKIDCYEGALEITPPTTQQCTDMGISTSYSANLTTLLANWKNNALGYQLVQDQFTQFMGSAHSRTPAWYDLQGPSKWSLLEGDTFSTPYQTYYGVAAYNH